MIQKVIMPKTGRPRKEPTGMIRVKNYDRIRIIDQAAIMGVSVPDYLAGVFNDLEIHTMIINKLGRGRE